MKSRLSAPCCPARPSPAQTDRAFMMTRLVGITATGLLAAALTTPGLGAAPQVASQHPTFRGGVELVDVDVVVFDKTSGEPIRGLTASDFTIVDRKAPQTIQTFSAIDFDHDPNEPALPPNVPLDVADNQTARSTRLVLLLVDDLHIAETLTPRTKDVVRRVLRDLGPQATVGLAFTSGRPGVELTEDRALVYDQIEGFKGMQKLRGGGVEPPAGSELPGGPPAVAHVHDPSGELGSTNYWLSNSLHATLAADAKVLGTETLRRKAFVLVSEGMPMDIQGLFDTMEPRPPNEPMSNSPGAHAPGPSHVDMDLLNAMTAMRRANVALYAIDPGADVPRTDLSAAADVPGASAPTAADPSARLSVLRGWNSPTKLKTPTDLKRTDESVVRSMGPAVRERRDRLICALALVVKWAENAFTALRGSIRAVRLRTAGRPHVPPNFCCGSSRVVAGRLCRPGLC